MMLTEEISDARQRVLDAAEQLFVERGYNAITLRDIADELGIKQASLYYHFPGGKEQLFVTMAERLFQRHRDGLMDALTNGRDLRSQLRAVAHWFGSQRPVSILGMFHAGIPALGSEQQEALSQLALESMYYPLRRAFLAAQERGEIRVMHPDMLAGSFLWLMDGLNYGQSRVGAPPRDVLVEDLLVLLLDGLRPRSDEQDVTSSVRMVT